MTSPATGAVVTARRPLAFITGASSGIGQALAWRMWQAGYDLALVARRGETLQAWRLSQGMDESRCRIYVADVSDIEQIVAAARSCICLLYTSPSPRD